MLLKLFPNAKFIYIARNPYFIYSSNITHFSSTFETLSFQRISKEELSANVLASYKKIIIDHYEQQKQLIPEGNLLEIRFEDFVAHPLQQAEAIYERLNLPGWEQAQAASRSHAATSPVPIPLSRQKQSTLSTGIGDWPLNGAVIPDYKQAYLLTINYISI